MADDFVFTNKTPNDDSFKDTVLSKKVMKNKPMKNDAPGETPLTDETTRLRSFSVASNRIVKPVVVFDSSVDSAVHRLRHPHAVKAVEMFSHAGDGGAVWLAILALLGRKDPKAAARAALVLAIGSALVNGPLKKVVSRTRPEPLVEGAFRPHGSSFPSGHSFSSWLVASMIPSSSAAKVPAVSIASGISASRVFLRYHHTSDVLAGAAIGVASGLLLRRLVKWS
jgi:undecaprenyl-diphosphatase